MAARARPARRRAPGRAARAAAPRQAALRETATKRSAGILLYRLPTGSAEPLVLVAHMGGPFWVGRDAGAWSIPKGEIGDGETPAAAALREFAEELGRPAPPGELVDLGDARLRKGKRLTVYALAGDYDADRIESSEFELEWPRGSGTIARFPEVDRAAWLSVTAARERLAGGQAEFLDRLLRHLEETPCPRSTPASG